MSETQPVRAAKRKKKNEDSLKDFGDNIELTEDLHLREVPGGGETEKHGKIF